MPRAQRAIATFILLLLPALSLAAAGQQEDVTSRYRVLEWKDLVPPDWEPPLVATAHDEVVHKGIDRDAVVAELEQQLVTLPGFIRPVVFENNQVSEFLLVPFLPHHTRQHAHLEANQLVYVSLLQPLQVDNPYQPVWVIGTITTRPVFTDEGPAAYSIADGLTTAYTY